MADHRVPSQPQRARHISANTCPHLSLYHPPSHVAGDDPQDAHWESVPQLVIMHGEMQHPHPIDAPNCNAAPARHHPSSPCRDANDTYVHMHRDVGVSETTSAQVHPVVPEVQENYGGLVVYGAQLPAADPPGAFPGVWPYPTAPANMPPANGLRNLANRYLNNPDTLVNMLRIEPGHDGRFEVWIVLELADVL